MKNRKICRRAPPRPWTPETHRETGRRIIAEATPASIGRALRIFANWLEEERGLATSTIDSQVSAVRSPGTIASSKACSGSTAV